MYKENAISKLALGLGLAYLFDSNRFESIHVGI